MKLNASIKNIAHLRRLLNEPKRLLALFIVIGAVLFLNTCASASLQGVAKVIDGDTITLVEKNGQKHTIRFFGIDAPETNTKQPFGEESKAFLASMIADKEVKIIVKDKDKYGRIVGIVKFDGKDINKIMVEKGYAWAYSYYTDAYTAEHNAAKAQKIGLWGDENATNKAIEPYKWRKSHRNKGFE